MTVKASISSEFLPFITKEIEEQNQLISAHSNKESYQWYDRANGPPDEHGHRRTVLNAAVKTSIGGPSRGMGKLAADRIAIFQRLLNARNETRAECYVRAEVHSAQVKAALESFRDQVLRRTTS